MSLFVFGLSIVVVVDYLFTLITDWLVLHWTCDNDSNNNANLNERSNMCVSINRDDLS